MNNIIQEAEKFLNASYNCEIETTKHVDWPIIVFCSIILFLIIIFFVISLNKRKKFQSKFQFIITLIFFIALFIISALKLKADWYYYTDSFSKAALAEGAIERALLRNGIAIIVRTVLEIIIVLFLRKRIKENKYVKGNNFILPVLYISFIINFYHIVYFLDNLKYLK